MKSMNHTNNDDNDIEIQTALECLSGNVMGTLCGYIEQFGSSSQKAASAALTRKILSHKVSGTAVPWRTYRQELFDVCGDWLWHQATNFWRMYEVPKMRVPTVLQQKVLDVETSDLNSKPVSVDTEVDITKDNTNSTSTSTSTRTRRKKKETTRTCTRTRTRTRSADKEDVEREREECTKSNSSTDKSSDTQTCGEMSAKIKEKEKSKSTETNRSIVEHGDSGSSSMKLPNSKKSVEATPAEYIENNKKKFENQNNATENLHQEAFHSSEYAAGSQIVMPMPISVESSHPYRSDEGYDTILAQQVVSSFIKEKSYPWRCALYFLVRRLQKIDTVVFDKILCAVLHSIILSRVKYQNTTNAVPDINLCSYAPCERIAMNSIVRLLLYARRSFQYNLIKYGVCRILSEIDSLLVGAQSFHIIPPCFPRQLFTPMDHILASLPPVDSLQMIPISINMIETVIGKVEYNSHIFSSFSGFDSFIIWAHGISNGTIRPDRVSHLIPDLRGIFDVGIDHWNGNSYQSNAAGNSSSIVHNHLMNPYCHYNQSSTVQTALLQRNRCVPRIEQANSLHMPERGIKSSQASNVSSQVYEITPNLDSIQQPYNSGELQQHDAMKQNQNTTTSAKKVKNFVDALDKITARKTRKRKK